MALGRCLIILCCTFVLSACAQSSQPQGPPRAASSAAPPAMGYSRTATAPPINPQDDARFQSIFGHCLYTSTPARDCQWPLGAKEPTFQCARAAGAQYLKCDYNVAPGSLLHYRCENQGGIVHCDLQ